MRIDRPEITIFHSQKYLMSIMKDMSHKNVVFLQNFVGKVKDG